MGSNSHSAGSGGQGGAISLEASNGSITIDGSLGSNSSSNSGPGGQAGAISLRASDGSITIDGGLFSSSSSYSDFGGQAGTISLRATNGNITTGNLASTSLSYSGTAGNGGMISLEAIDGSISTGRLSSRSGSYSGTSANGGAINLKATYGNITTGNLDSHSQSSSSDFAGNGGAISLEASNGNITTGNFDSHSFSFVLAGNGGAISLEASNGNITTGNFDSHSSSFDLAGNGGVISLKADSGNISTGFLHSYSFSVSGFGGQGGAISLGTNNGNITTDNLSSYSSSSEGTAGNGGAINLKAINGNITTGDLFSSSFSDFGTGGNGGAISLEATNTIKPGSINSIGALGSGNITINSQAAFTLDNRLISSDTFGSGKGGDIQITAPSISVEGGAQVSASSHSSGQGGNITLGASDKVELNGAIADPLFLFAPTGLAGIPPDTFLGGFIRTGDTKQVRVNGTLYPSGAFTQTTVGSTGSAGNLKIETGRLLVKDGAAIATTTFGQGSNAGSISIDAKDSISIANGSILSGVAPGARGDSGAVELQTRSLSVVGGGVVQTQTLGEGKAGDIQVNTLDAVSLSGAGSGLRSGSGGSNNLLGTEGSFVGVGGNISVITDKLSVADRAVLDAQTQTNSKGGNITVNADILSAQKGGQLLTSTSGAGQAGDIMVNAKQIQLSGSNSGLFAQTSSEAKAGNLTLQPLDNGQTLKVDFQDGAQVSASTSSSGSGGKLTVTAPESITLSGNGSIISAETTGKGAGGDLTLRTGSLAVRDGAQVTVSSAASGSAGLLSVEADSIRLDNGAKIRADTRGGGGNIDLRSRLLVLRHGSSITTNAQGSSIPGGNITFDAKNGFIVAVNNENSDISANSADFRGGNVIIKAAGIFGTQFRDVATPQTSDITATGANPDLSGTVQINTPDVDPNSGLVNLPDVPVDTQVAQSCTAGGTVAKSEFIITGRGGLPANPGEVLSTDAVEVNLITLNSNNNRNSPTVTSKITTATPKRIVEATGWVLNEKGEVVLIANSPTATPSSPWSNQPDCKAS